MLTKHFVTCAICKIRYPARTVKTKFCNECQCMVCSACKCERYHLDFQLAQWDGVEAKEQKEANSKVARNKKKRQKKKLRAKKQKKQNKKNKGTSSHSLYAEDHDGSGGSRSPSVSPAMKSSHPNQKGMKDMSLHPSNGGTNEEAASGTGEHSGGGRSRKRGNGGGRSMVMGRQQQQSENAQETVTSQRTNSTTSNSKGKNRSRGGDRVDTNKEYIHSAPNANAGNKSNNATPNKNGSAAPVLRASSADMEENNKLVSFFEQTGSILDLANFLDENGEDDGMTPEELAELQREMKAMKK